MKKDSVVTIPIILFHDYKGLPIPSRAIKKIAERIVREERLSTVHLTNVIFCSDHTIRKLNKTYRHKDAVTDVLSFPIHRGELLGEIYISLQRAKVQARRFGCSYNDEIVRLFVHGFLHLLGYDHKKPSERKRMEAMEKKYL